MRLPAVAGEGRHADQRGGLAAADRAELAHPRDQGRRRDGADARNRSQDPVALRMLLRAGDQLLDPPVILADAGVKLREDFRDRPVRSRIADLVEGQLQVGALVHELLPEHEHVAEPVDRHAGRRRGRHVRKRGPEGGQRPGVDPVRLRQLAAGPGEVPGLAGVDHADGEAAVMQGLEEGPVHPAGGLDDGPLRAAVPQDAGDLAEAVPVVGGGVVPAAEMDVECLLADVDSGGYDGHGLPLLSSR